MMLYSICYITFLFCLCSIPRMLYHIPKCYIAQPVMPDVRDSNLKYLAIRIPHEMCFELQTSYSMVAQADHSQV